MMMARSLEQQNAIREYNITNGNKLKVLSNSQYGLVADVCEALEPFLSVTHEVSFNDASLACVWPTFLAFEKSLTIQNDYTNQIEDLRKKLVENLSERMGGYEDSKPVVMACFLDPRFKSRFFRKESTKSKLFFFNFITIGITVFT